MKNNQKQVFHCPVCGFHYKDKELAERCEAFCRQHGACSLEITKHALENISNN